MKKEAELYLLAILLLGVVFLLSFFQTGFTGQAVLTQYTNESSCVNAGYIWEVLTEETCTVDESCIECEEGCVLEYTEILCEEECVVSCDINATGCIECEEGCVLEYTEILCEEGCVESCEVCEDVIIGGQCVGEICDAENLNLCLTSEECEFNNGYWYNELCNAEEEPSCLNNLDLCLTEEDCISQLGFWYEDFCHEEECLIDNHCGEGYECSSGNCIVTIEEEIEEEIGEEPVTPSALTESSIAPESVLQIPTYSFSIGGASNLKVVSAEPKEATISLTNNGASPLSACKLSVTGNYAEWITSSTSLNVNKGEQKPILFEVKVPENIDAGEYKLSLSVKCAETSSSKELVLNVIEKTFEFELISVRKIRNDEVRAIYELNDLSGKDQTLGVKFSLLDDSNIEISSMTDNLNLTANKTDRFRTIIPVDANKSIEGNMTISAEINSQIYSSIVKEAIVLSPPLLGFVAFEDITQPGSLAVLGLFVLALIIIIFIARRIRKSKKLKKSSQKQNIPSDSKMD